MHGREPVPGYRRAAVPSASLWQIVEDPTAEPPIRAGAAVALVQALDEPGRQRLRVAAQACAAPKLRVALELVAEEAELDESRLEDALEGVRKAR
jgi:hypothetical protein